MDNILVLCVKTIDEQLMIRLRAVKGVCQHCLIVSKELRDFLGITFSEPDKVLSDQNIHALISGLSIFNAVGILPRNLNGSLVPDRDFYFFEADSTINNGRNALVTAYLVEKTNRKCHVYALVFEDGVFERKQTFPPPRQ